MCFGFKKRSSTAEARNGKASKKKTPRGVKKNLLSSKNKEDQQLKSPKPKDLKTVGDPAFDDERAKRVPTKKSAPLSSTPVNDQEGEKFMDVEKYVHRQTLNDLFQRMLLHSSEKFKLEHQLWKWRVDFTARVDQTPVSQLKNQFDENFNHLVEKLNSALSTASSLNKILSKSQMIDPDKKYRSMRLLEQFEQVNKFQKTFELS
jgi:hypothetical protein